MKPDIDPETLSEEQRWEILLKAFDHCLQVAVLRSLLISWRRIAVILNRDCDLEAVVTKYRMWPKIFEAAKQTVWDSPLVSMLREEQAHSRKSRP